MRRFGLWVLVTVLYCPAFAQADPPLRFGVFPRWNAQTMVRDYTPLAHALGAALGRDVQIETDKDFDSFMQRVAAREFDLVHLNQLQYLQAHEKVGYRAIAKLCESPECTIRALLVTRADFPIKTVADLRGKTVAVGDPNAMVSHLLAREILRRHGLLPDDYRVTFTRNPPNALLAVYNGAADAAGVGSPVLHHDEIKRRVDIGKLRILAESEPIPTLPVAVRNDLDPELVKALQAALRTLHESSAGASALARVGATHFATAKNAEYTPLQSLITPPADATH